MEIFEFQPQLLVYCALRKGNATYLLTSWLRQSIVEFRDGKTADFTTVAIFATSGENSHIPVSKQTVKVQLSLDVFGKITCVSLVENKWLSIYVANFTLIGYCWFSPLVKQKAILTLFNYRVGHLLPIFWIKKSTLFMRKNRNSLLKVKGGSMPFINKKWYHLYAHLGFFYRPASEYQNSRWLSPVKWGQWP